MAWPLVIAGTFFGFALILIKVPVPMLIAVTMYLPFDSTATIFVGGIIRVVLDKIMARRVADLFHVSDYRIRLNETGTAVWERCDGTTTGREIADELRVQFGDRVEPAEDRL